MSHERSPIDVDYEIRLADEHHRRQRDLERADRLSDFHGDGFHCPALSAAMRELASKREAA